MPYRECTITLQDVAVQLRLPVDREPLIGSLRYNLKVICKDILGVVPSDMKGQRLSLLWLAEQFEELPSDVDVVSVQRYARAYIMQLIGGFLFAYKSNTLVHCMFLKFVFDFNQVGTYAWGATTLAWLYRELYRVSHAQSLKIVGPLMLLQVWAYNGFPIIAPQRTLQHSDGRHLNFRLIGRRTHHVALFPLRCRSGQAV
ncbi:serine/threonine-protein phosphatase 7 long form homolog [Cucumis melo]|uniref:Serine/threonine-protein phosphatase 7 long form homolog n=1 Tax=Cucumis melo TaxID=3656 RepID=A0A1S3B9E8_CUCME|nr:serine/threonine-protein phosphatase 7 long form homolog [Cucumis melo]